MSWFVDGVRSFSLEHLPSHVSVHHLLDKNKQVLGYGHDLSGLEKKILLGG